MTGGVKFTPEQRLRAFWTHTKPGPNGCILWIGSAHCKGYGRFSDGTRMVPAHRWIYEQTFGVAISADLEACHRCDVPACVNPEHIFPGTKSENTLDSVAKGRHVCNLPGVRFLSNEQARAIRLRVSAGDSQQRLAVEFDVSAGVVSHIVSGRTYRDAGGPARGRKRAR